MHRSLGELKKAVDKLGEKDAIPIFLYFCGE